MIFECNSIDKAIEILKKIEKANGEKNKKILICTIDFDNNTHQRKTATPEEGCGLIRKSKTIFFNEDKYFPHMELYSRIQNIDDIKAVGVMHDIIWCGKGD